jgi:hypothetical protein
MAKQLSVLPCIADAHAKGEISNGLLGAVAAIASARLPTGLISTAPHSSWRQDRYLAFRDGPCRIPECEGIGKTQAHHIFEDRMDRVTSVEYMINLCSRDHQEHHDGRFTITGKPEQTVTFTYNDGRALTSTARPSARGPKTPKPIPLSKHRPTEGGEDLFAESA